MRLPHLIISACLAVSPAFAAAESNSFVVAQPDQPVMRAMHEWETLRGGDRPFSAYVEFLDAHPNWPDRDLLLRQAERAITEATPARDVVAFFEGRQPDTGSGAIALALAQTALGEDPSATISSAWQTMAMTEEEAAQFEELWPDYLPSLNRARLENLLWAGEMDAAERMLHMVHEDYATLAEARIALRRQTRDVDEKIAAVPEALANDPGLAFERYLWRANKGRWEDAEEMLVSRTASAGALGRPEHWALRRRGIAREAMFRGAYERAYELASQHYLSASAGGANYADLEWFAGYVALTKLNDPSRALEHFRAFDAVVSTPISKGRAGYWIGRAQEALGEEPTGYRAGAAHSTTFYGILAREALGEAVDPSWLPDGIEPIAAIPAHVRDNDLIEVGLAYLAEGQAGHARRFFIAAVEESPEDARAIAQIALNNGAPTVALSVAKSVAGREIIQRAYFPMVELSQIRLGAPAEVVLGLSRQESEFNPHAVSHADARGMMQLLPSTAELIAGEIEASYDEAALTRNWRYNMRLGSAYLGAQLSRFNNNLILAAAAYNAGPNVAKTWGKQMSMPNGTNEEVADWIENIPYSETRNYVMRVLEASYVYAERLGKPRSMSALINGDPPA
ncbi:lytic transglycosylase domain-containing protein [Paracoccaceae bacterium GXU_MW_L88]